MSDTDKTYTLAEVRKMQREAFMEGAVAHAQVWSLEENDRFAKIAERCYPAPTKPRVVTTRTGLDYRICNGVLELFDCGIWKESCALDVTDVKALASLLAHPEEPCNE